MESRRFDQLTVSVATGSSRRRVLAGLGTVAIGMLLGRDAEAKPSGNKGNSEPNSNASCAAGCAQKFKAKGKNCKKKDDKSDKKQCLRDAKTAQVLCRQKCETAENTAIGTGTETGTAPDAGTETGDELSVMIRPACTMDAAPEVTAEECGTDKPGNCLKATCVTVNNRARCVYERQKSVCKGENHICCNYRRDAENSGMCVADVADCEA